MGRRLLVGTMQSYFRRPGLQKVKYCSFYALTRWADWQPEHLYSSDGFDELSSAHITRPLQVCYVKKLKKSTVPPKKKKTPNIKLWSVIFCVRTQSEGLGLVESWLNIHHFKSVHFHILGQVWMNSGPNLKYVTVYEAS